MSALPVVPLNGLNADSLGAYLASLGLFSLATRQWPRVRACWRNARFCLVGGPATMAEVVSFVSEIGKESKWSLYDRPWDKNKKADAAKKTSTQTARWRALEAEERSLSAFGAHLALDGRIRMNPLLGTGGNAGKRDFVKGWKDAVQVIKEPRNQSRDVLNNDLKAFLSGGACTYLDSLLPSGMATNTRATLRRASWDACWRMYRSRGSEPQSNRDRSCRRTSASTANVTRRPSSRSSVREP